MTVIELLETVEPDDEVIAACKELKRRGYTLALDDFVYHQGMDDLIALADIIKIDFMETEAEERNRIFAELAGNGHRIVAEKVETQEQFAEAIRLGSHYVQGYYFCKPKVISRKGITPDKVNYIHLLREINRPNIDYDRMEKLIKSDLALSFGLLKLMNSAAFAFSKRIESIRQALVLLGQQNIRKWFSLVALSKMATDKPQELVVNSIIRATFCESLGLSLGMNERREDLFLMGMFSMIDAILDQPLEDALAQLPLSDEVKECLLGNENAFRPVMELAMTYERGQWQRFAEEAKEAGLSEATGSQLYYKALRWVEAIQC